MKMPSGEADPDYFSVNGAKNHHQTIAHQPDDEMTSNKIIEDTLSSRVTTPGLESHPKECELNRGMTKRTLVLKPTFPLPRLLALRLTDRSQKL